MTENHSFLKRVKKIINIFGPGIITGASDDDPSGIVTYTQAGSQFGFATLWTSLLTFPLMAAVQGMCARIGLVSGQGLTVTLKQHYPPAILYAMLLFSFPAITLNIGADIQSMGAVAQFIFPKIPAAVFSIAFTIILLVIIIKYPYQKIAGILKWLCLSLLLYMIVPFMVKQNWAAVAKNTFIPTIRFDKQFLSILVAILGTTISPYLFFWQATMEAEDIAHSSKKVIVGKRMLGDMKTDVNTGMLLSNIVMFFIILTAGSVLFPAGIRDIETVEQAARALEPLAGKFASLFFAIGVISTGFLAIPVLAGSQSYMLAETFGWKAGLDKAFPQAKSFYVSIIISVIAGLSMDFWGLSPIHALLYTAILYGITSPPMIAMVLHIGNNKKIMGQHVNSKLSNLLGIITLLFMTAAACIYIYLLIAA